ncbi:hypothetical protein GEMRC1_009399 [Eukaryota sp. GEM-RC1]
MESNKGWNLDMSLFERLISNNFPFCTLLTQYRMRPEISGLIKPFYPQFTIEDGSNVHEYPPVKGMKQSLMFFNHDHPEDGDNDDLSKSKTNVFEAQMAVNLALYLMHQGYVGEDIAIVTPYLGQMFVLREILQSTNIDIILNEGDAAEIEKLEDENEEAQNPTISDLNDPKTKAVTGQALGQVKLATIDTFQGLEATIVIVSLTRCNSAGSIGFLKFDNRINVMLSRAKHGMYVLGSKITIEKYEAKNLARANPSPETLISKVVNQFEAQNLIFDYFETYCSAHQTSTLIYSVNDWNQVESGGCDELCGIRRPCGHLCQKRCHVSDPHHEITDCNEPCSRICSDCGSHCKLKCFQKCQCKRMVKIDRPCMHSIYTECFKRNSLPLCCELVNLDLPWCQHEQKVPCHEAQRIRRNPSKFLNICKELCHEELECDHECIDFCGNCCEKTLHHLAEQEVEPEFPLTPSVHDKCRAICNKEFKNCGHSCKQSCHPTTSCPPCTNPCDKKCGHGVVCKETCSVPCTPCTNPCLEHCSHRGQCPLPCSSPCLLPPCQFRCTKTLPCGCQCPSMCSEVCPSADYCQKCGTKGDEIVDLIEFLPFKDINLDEFPVIVLNCGHFWTVDFLDEMLHFKSYYERLDDGSFDLKPFPSEPDFSQTNCPNCRGKLQGISRYNRILKTEQLLISAQKYHYFVNHCLTNTNTQLVKHINGFRKKTKNPNTKTGALKNAMLAVFKINPISSKLKQKLNVLQIAKDSAYSFCSRNLLDKSLITIPEAFPTTMFELEKAKSTMSVYYFEMLCLCLLNLQKISLLFNDLEFCEKLISIIHLNCNVRLLLPSTGPQANENDINEILFEWIIKILESFVIIVGQFWQN